MAALRKVKVQLISDIVWPWCYIAQKHLRIASEQAGIPVSIEWLPFFLNPNMKPEGEDIREHLAKKYGPEAAAKFGQPGNSLYVAGDKVGIKFNPDRRVVPTMDCHRAIEWCKKEYKDEDDKVDDHCSAFFA